MIDGLSIQQASVAKDVQQFVSDSIIRRADRRCFVLHGLAGTGKTYLWSWLARKHPGAILITPTGKAASVLRKRSGLEVRTIHSLIFDFRGLVDDEEEKGRKNPIFVDKEGLDLSRNLVFLDESSMVGKRLAEQLLETGAILVACGDPGQLPPVNDTQFFTDADATLTEIHRQALESPIIRQAHRVRNNGCYEADGDGFRVISFAEPEDILGADMLLCYRNDMRRKLNAKKRKLLGFQGSLKAGEPIMCLRNNHKVGIYNGEIYRLEENRTSGKSTMIRSDDGRLVHLAFATVEGDNDYNTLKYNDRFTPFAPAYASTVHKFQGSECPSVLLLDEHPNGVERKSFLYTGMTRASEKCTMVSWR